MSRQLLLWRLGDRTPQWRVVVRLRLARSRARSTWYTWRKQLQPTTGSKLRVAGLLVTVVVVVVVVVVVAKWRGPLQPGG